jgi:pyrroline-5-carboxylate reductase
MADGKIWLFGCGNMGGAMLNGWLASGVDPARVTIIDPHVVELRVPAGVTLCRELPADGPAPDILVLAIKPQQLNELVPSLSPHIGANTQVISILAGVECSILRDAFPEAAEIVRAMPNTPASIGRGVTVIFAPDTQDRSALTALFAPLGVVEWLEEEQLFHAVIALSGSGPAFVFRYIGAVIDAGIALGLHYDQARRLTCATVEGAAALALHSREEPTDLAQRVRSPNGTTNAGLLVLEKDMQFVNLMHQIILATARRSEEMSKEARLEAGA